MNQEIKILGGIGLATIIILALGAFILGGNSPTPSQTLTSDQQKILVRPDSNKITTPFAKLTLVEFGDYQCPACGAAYPVVKDLLKTYKTKLNFVFRNFAFLGQESTWAAEGAECAGEEGKYWEYHDYLYANQRGENEGAFTKDKLKAFAKTLNLDSEKFDKCLDLDKYLDKVLNDASDGKNLGVDSTPTFFLNGEIILGVSDLKSKIDQKLK